MNLSTMHIDSKAFTVLNLLLDGPATTADVVAETGWDRRNAHAHLAHLVKRGKARREPFVQGQCRWLWIATDAGEQSARAALARMEQP